MSSSCLTESKKCPKPRKVAAASFYILWASGIGSGSRSAENLDMLECQ
jgi:hypothetical protein